MRTLLLLILMSAWPCLAQEIPPSPQQSPTDPQQTSPRQQSPAAQPDTPQPDPTITVPEGTRIQLAPANPISRRNAHVGDSVRAVTTFRNSFPVVPPASNVGSLQEEQQHQQQEQQQREQQQREQQAREQQQREQQQREQQAREQQQREQQQREQQAREQQQREQQQRQAQVVNSSGGAASSSTKELPSPSRSAAASNEKDSKSAESDLRRRTCENEPCRETPAAPKPDLRQRICKERACAECPPGEIAGKNGVCLASTPAKSSPVSQCQPNETWNGAACVTASAAQCSAGELWDGLRCVNTTPECAPFTARGATQQNEIRGIRTEMERACRNNRSGQKCVELHQSYDAAILRYRMLMNEAPVACRSLLLDPLAI